MKLRITLIAFSLFSLLGYSQDKAYDLLKDKTQTNILYDRVYNISNATNFNFKGITTNNFLQVYHELQRADFNQRLPKLDALKAAGDMGFAQKQIPFTKPPGAYWHTNCPLNGHI